MSVMANVQNAVGTPQHHVRTSHIPKSHKTENTHRRFLLNQNILRMKKERKMLLHGKPMPCLLSSN